MGAEIKIGDQYKHPHTVVGGSYARVMAVADGYAMIRYARAIPVVRSVAELRGWLPHKDNSSV